MPGMTDIHPGEQQVVKTIQAFCWRLSWGASALQLLTIAIAMAAIVLSLLVATYTGQDSSWLDVNRIKLLAFLSAVFTAVYSTFRIRKKAADLRDGYRLLNTELLHYKVGAITVEKLIESYSRTEKMIGHVEVDGLGARGIDKPQ